MNEARITQRKNFLKISDRLYIEMFVYIKKRTAIKRLKKCSKSKESS